MNTTVPAPEIRPFPFASLDAVTAEEARAQRALRSIAETAFDLSAISRAITELSGGGAVEILLRRVRRASRARGADDFVGVALAPEGAAGLAESIVVEAEGALVAAVARRVLKRPPMRVFEKGRPPSPELVGAFAAIAASVSRRAHARAPVTLVAAGPGAVLFSDLVRLTGDAFTLSLTVVFEHDAFEARVSVGRAQIDLAKTAPFGRDVLASLGEMPIALPIAAATAVARARDVADLMPGDAFMPGLGAIALAAGAPRGAMKLCAPRAEIGLAARAEAPDKLIFSGELVSLAWSEESMNEESTKTEVAIADAPVVVRVEVGAAELPAREWASLQKGDTISLKKRLGEAVTLRVSGVEVARGELVQIDGEVGVRILARIG